MSSSRHFLLISILSLAATVVAHAADLPRFANGAIWNRDISQAPLDANSTAMLSTLQGLGGWGSGDLFQIDFSNNVVHAPSGSPTASMVPEPGYYLPDCDTTATLNSPQPIFPLPSGGAVEGSNNYICDFNNSDCHLLVVQGTTLFESFASNKNASGLQSLCALHWDLSKVYPPEGRGEHCTSTDAAGFPVAPLLFNADEVAAALNVVNGDLGHVIRFILPNNRIAASMYVHPATHGITATTGSAASVPYGVHLRLKSSFNMTNYNAAAKVILRTMQRYGIVHADGGNIALTAESDLFTTAKWTDANIAIDSHSLYGAQVTDFEVIEAGAQRTVTYACERVADDFIFIDHFDY